VVLINEGSASASEILAGALKDQNQSQLIGQKSFGKGSVQEQIQLSDNSSLKVTIAKWLTPNGNLIDENGLEPDIKVEAPEEKNGETEQPSGDPVLDKAIEFLKNIK
jgi:carboxyl-terminal processing protease